MESIQACRCGAEVSTDRKRCPHCGAAVVSVNSRLEELLAQNARLTSQRAAQIAALEAKNKELTSQLAAANDPTGDHGPALPAGS